MRRRTEKRPPDPEVRRAHRHARGGYGFVAGAAAGFAAFVAAGAAEFVAAGAFVFALAAGAVTGAAAFVAAGLAGAFAFVAFVVGAGEPHPIAVTTRPASAKPPAAFRNTFLVNVAFSSKRNR